ncbi:hypothetical protein C1646_686448 [Rhizophagus diaphanus]|nr:hypothetical protein C1646_686448 [Rhizophagus diaphanus] [Rhizophagus sp. MUCL 43196]
MKIQTFRLIIRVKLIIIVIVAIRMIMVIRIVLRIIIRIIRMRIPRIGWRRSSLFLIIVRLWVIHSLIAMDGINLIFHGKV